MVVLDRRRPGVDRYHAGTRITLAPEIGSILVKATLSPEQGQARPEIESFDVGVESERAESGHYLFTGKERDTSGLYYFNARYYDAETGRFVEDPAGHRSNWYEYCNSNPMLYLDSNGMWAQKTHGDITREVAEHAGWYLREYLDALVAGAMSVDDILSSAACPWSVNRHFDTKPNFWQYTSGYIVGSIVLPGLGGSIGVGFTPFITKGGAPTRVQFAESRKHDAIGLWRMGKKQEALFMIGQGLHALQDIISHGFIMPIMHLFNKRIKDIENHPDADEYSDLIINTKTISIIYLREFIYFCS